MMDIENLKRWSRQWRVFGDQIQCTDCLSGQHYTYADEPFEHKGRCKHKEDIECPWHSLHNTLEAILDVPKGQNHE